MLQICVIGYNNLFFKQNLPLHVSAASPAGKNAARPHSAATAAEFSAVP